MKDYKTVKEIAQMYGVTTSGVRYWISKGLPFKVEKVVGVKPRKVIHPDDVPVFLGLTERREDGQMD
jgi:hypothetical protein